MSSDPATADDTSDFSQLRLQSGELVQVEIMGQRFVSRFIGSLTHRSLIITTPVANKRLVPVRNGQELVIRVMLNDRALAFVSDVRQVYRLPYPHLHLAWPEDLVMNEIRKAVRVETRCPVTVTNLCIGDRAREIEGTLLDLSETGARLVTPIRIGKTGDDISLAIQLRTSGMQRALRIKGIVRARLKPRAETVEREVHYGIEFADLRDDDRVELIAFVYSELARGKGV